MLKKIISLVLCFAMLAAFATCFTGCGKDKVVKAGGDTSIQVTLKWAIMSEHIGHADDDLVFEAFNEKLAELLPNTKVEFLSLDADNWSRWMAAGQQVDIAWSGYLYNIENQARELKAYQNIEPYVEKYGTNIKKEREIWVDAYRSGEVDDQLYAIPNMQPWVKETFYLQIPASLYQYFPTDRYVQALHSDPHTTEEVYQILTEYLDTITANGAIKGPGLTGFAADILNVYANRGYEKLDSGDNTAYDAFADEVKVFQWVGSEPWELAMKYRKLWYEKGYFNDSKNASAGSLSDAFTLKEQGMWFDEFLNVDAQKGIFTEADKYGEVETYNILINTREEMYNGVSESGSEATYSIIPITAANPERAIMLLDLLRTPEDAEKGKEVKELVDLLVYGFEGDESLADDPEAAAADHKHYYRIDVDGDGVKEACKGYDYINQPSASSAYGIPLWILTNSFIPSAPEYYLAGQNEYALDYYQNVRNNVLHKTPVYGMRVSNAKITNQLSNITSASKEYYSIYKLADQFEAKKAALLDAVKVAGMDEVVKEMQAQCDAYVAANK